jgi:hypothetical protein
MQIGHAKTIPDALPEIIGWNGEVNGERNGGDINNG